MSAYLKRKEPYSEAIPPTDTVPPTPQPQSKAKAKQKVKRRRVDYDSSSDVGTDDSSEDELFDAVYGGDPVGKEFFDDDEQVWCRVVSKGVDKHRNRYLQYMPHGNKEASSVREVRAWYAKKCRDQNANVAHAFDIGISIRVISENDQTVIKYMFILLYHA